MGDTPVALCCFLRMNLSPIFGEIAGQGRHPFVLYIRREEGEGRRERERERERERK